MKAITQPHSIPDAARECADALAQLRAWIEAREFAGYEPFDLLNSPWLAGRFRDRKLLASLFIQTGKRVGGLGLRKWLRVPPSRNPKALGLCLAAYCDLQRLGGDYAPQANFLKSKLLELRSPAEPLLSWGYDWDYVSLRGGELPKFSPNSIATYFCAVALLDMAEVFHDPEAAAMALSAGEFLVQRLDRLVDSADHVCFSYYPGDRTLVYNSSVLVGSLLARLGTSPQNLEYLSLARRSMRYLADAQAADGSWTYGPNPLHRWKDGFHTGYHLCALLQYREATGDAAFDVSIHRGYEFFKSAFFRDDGAPKYYHDRLYPIDIHCCSQAILTFCAFRDHDPEALALASRTALWTLGSMRNEDGSFFYQRHRFRSDRTPYMRWGQAWMFHALARLQRVLTSKA